MRILNCWRQIINKMGYSTDFKGELKFKIEPNASQLAELKKFLGKDRREIGFKEDNLVYDSDEDDEYWYHINLEFTDDFSGVKWNGAEKTYGLNYIINFLTKQMKKTFKDFELIGELSAQGEEADDRWVLKMIKGVAIKIELTEIFKECVCPHCGEKIKKVKCFECEEDILIDDLIKEIKSNE